MHMRFLIVLSIAFLIGCDAKGGDLLANTSEVVTGLERLKLESKFMPDNRAFYPGAPNELIRVEAEKTMNVAIDSLINFGRSGPTEEQFWQVLEGAARSYSEMDSEELDRALLYMERLMEIYSIQSSDGRLDQWRYGFDPSQS